MSRIHPQLQKDCMYLGRFELSHLLLMNNASYPWFILVPDRDEIREIYQLSQNDQRQLWQESSNLSALLMKQFDGDKLNVAAIGNIVSQLHIHHVVRYRNDLCWPAPVWGQAVPNPYHDEELRLFLSRASLDALPGYRAK